MEVEAHSSRCATAPRPCNACQRAPAVHSWNMDRASRALATAALDLSNGHAEDRQPLIAHLRDEGMTEDEANDFIQGFRDGKTLLAVAIVPGEIEAPYVEQLAENHGASYAMTCDAPRY